MADVDEIYNKGLKLAPVAKDRYNCPKTGAHFEFKDVCRRLERMHRLRRKEFGDSAKAKRIHTESEVMENENKKHSVVNELKVEPIILKEEPIKVEPKMAETKPQGYKRSGYMSAAR